MKLSRILPVSFLTLGLMGSGAMIATAQNMPAASNVDTAQMQEQVQRANHRSGMNGHHGQHGGGLGMDGHHGKRGGGGGMKRGGGMMRALLGQVDADGNGAITQEEIDTFRAAKVAEADASGDGALSIDEFDTVYRELTRARMVDMFQDFDADGDGVISTEEMDARFGDVVERMDRDGDGALTPQDRGRRG